MLYWECKKRLERLKEFRALITEYFQTVGRMSGSGRLVPNEASVPIRKEINERMKDVLDSCHLVREDMTVFYSPPPLLGGYQGRLNLLLELFELRDSYHLPIARATDGLDRVIGEYERKAKWLFRQIFNPFFWLHWGFVKIVRLPFQILGAAGFDSARLENSLAGKIVKATVGFISFFAALLTVLQTLGWLDAALKLARTFWR